MEIELQNRTFELSETNTALKVLLNQREKDKEELGEKVLSNVKSLVEPYLKELKNSRVDQRQIVSLDLLESGLKNILSSFSGKLSSKYLGLTPGELQVAYLIKEGKRTKEIAELLNLSGKTIEDYRKNLRQKLGIRNVKVNLRTHLLSIQK
ncbi:MAG: helix-turn-helix transcriptional regulator [Deltaproteobacteria bacterium]|nr:helix-turn-helix transcriptional regulator [Deltaproteobacteria bacterium]